MSKVSNNFQLHLEEDISQITVLKSAIDEGLSSGIVEDFDPKAHLESLKKKS